MTERGDLRGAVLGVLQNAVDVAGAENAELTVASSNPGTAETTAQLTPKRAKGAPVLVHLEEGVPLIDVTLGRGGFFEVPTTRGRYTDLSALDEVRALSLAAVRGRYRETVWVKRDEVVRSHGVAQIGSREVPVRWAQLISNPFRRARRLELTYEPYDSVECPNGVPADEPGRRF